MPRSTLVRRAATCGAVMAVAGGVTGSALADSTPVATAVRTEAKVLKSSSALKSLAHVNIKNRAQAKREEPKLAQLVVVLDHAATVVSHAHATTAAEKTGQADWVKGVRRLAKGVHQLNSGIKAVVSGNETTGDNQILTAEKTTLAAETLVAKADKLLGVTST